MSTLLSLDSDSRILLTRMRFVGDVVLTTPVIRSVRAAFPRSYLAFMGDKNAVSLLDHNPHLDEVIPFDFSRPTALEQPRVIWLLRRRRFDVAVDLFGNPRSALLTFLSRARIRIGGDFGLRGRLFTHRIADDGRPKTAVEFHYQYVRPLGVEPAGWNTEVFLTEEERREARIYLRWQDVDVGAPVVGIHAGASWPAKIWPAERFGDLARALVGRIGAQVVLTPGPGEVDRAHEIAARAGPGVRVLDVLPLRQLAAVQSWCSAYVANDAGPLHISVAVGTPTVGIFGPGEEEIWFPYVPPYYEADAGHVALRKDVFCHPCHLNVCNRSGEGYMECMTLLSVEEVLDAVSKRLRRASASS